jgi:hypothetical protein
VKFVLQILFFFFTWFTNLNAAPVFTKIALPSYKLSFSKIESAKEESVIKIGVQNYARSSIEATKISSYLTKAKTLGSVKYLENIINAGLKATKSTANTLIFTTALNLEIFRYSSITSNYVFKSTLLKNNIVKVILKLDNIKYSTDISTTLKTATVEIVEAADGTIGWRTALTQAGRQPWNGFANIFNRI